MKIAIMMSALYKFSYYYYNLLLLLLSLSLSLSLSLLLLLLLLRTRGVAFELVGEKARGGQFSAYFLFRYLTRVLFILFFKYQQGPLRETEA